MLAVLDASRRPAYASNVFGSCKADLVVGRFDHLALSIRSDGSRPDEVWFYDGKTLQKLPQLRLAAHIEAAQKALALGNRIQAARHLLAVADHGDPRGPFGLAELAIEGEAIDRDEVLARDLYTRAAELGHAPAMLALGNMLAKGLGGDRDLSGAVRWIRRSAERGHGAAQLQLAMHMQDGHGVSLDLVNAYVWYRLAEVSLAGTPKASIAKLSAETIEPKLMAIQLEEAAKSVASFRPGPAGAIWDLPAEWRLWERRFPLNRVRGTTLFEMPQFRALMRPLIGASVYDQLPSISNGPGSIHVEKDWLVISGCRAHSCASHNYLIGLRLDGNDAVACVLLPRNVKDPSDQVSQATFARARAPRHVREFDRDGMCAKGIFELLTLAPQVPSRTAQHRDAPWPPVLPEVNPGQPPRIVAKAPKQPISPGSKIGSGTAWQIAPRRFMTNLHVVDSCGSVRLGVGERKEPATVFAQDRSLDLALLDSGLQTETTLSLRTTPPKPAEPVIVAGFPLQGLLASGAQVSTGIVTALAGIKNDATRLQISAPIQPGNSGGPVLDRRGSVVGIASSTLGTLATTEATGALPQNVNFAIKAEYASKFLLGAGLSERVAGNDHKVSSTEDVALVALSAVAVVECFK